MRGRRSGPAAPGIAPVCTLEGNGVVSVNHVGEARGLLDAAQRRKATCVGVVRGNGNTALAAWLLTAVGSDGLTVSRASMELSRES